MAAVRRRPVRSGQLVRLREVLQATLRQTRSEVKAVQRVFLSMAEAQNGEAEAAQVDQPSRSITMAGHRYSVALAEVKAVA